jgi:hypothetical protein
MFRNRIPPFFVPAAEHGEQAEYVYATLSELHAVPVTPKRIWALRWKHKGVEYLAKVGKRMPQALAPGEGPVIAILKSQDCYLLVSHNRGVLGGDPVRAGVEGGQPIYFASAPEAAGGQG